MNAHDRLSVAFFGVRGSRPVADARYMAYGGNSSCVGVSLGDVRLLLDAGTGIANVPEAYWKGGRTHVFLTHLHHDHIAGLMFYGALYEEGCKVYVHVPSGMESGALEAYWKVPYFPIPLGETRADVQVERLFEEKPVIVGGPQDCSDAPHAQLIVEAKHLGQHVHPSSGVTVYRVTGGRSVLVYATDVELADERSKQCVADFAHGADLLILDAHFTEEEYRSFAGWGHNSIGIALEVAVMSECRRLALFHHHPNRDDNKLAELERVIAKRHPHAKAAREGEEIVL